MVLMWFTRTIGTMLLAGGGQITTLVMMIMIVIGTVMMIDTILANRILQLMNWIPKRTYPQPGENADKQEMS